MKQKLLVLLLFATFSFLTAVPRELVVVEIATGTWCGYCPGAAMGAHDLLANGHAVAIVKNHNGDSYANTYSNARNSYYGVTGYPSAYFDGLNVTSGGSASQSMYSNYLPKVNARLAIPSKYTISANGMLNGTQLTVVVSVAKPEADSNTNVVLHSSITQSNIPHVWGNQTHVDNVNRIMSPSQSGTPVNLNTGEQTDIPLTFTLNSAWNIADLELVLWLQNTTSKETLQGKKYSLAALTGAYPVSHETLDFPDMYVGGTSTIPVSFTNFSDVMVNATVSITNPAFAISTSTLAIPSMQSSTVNVTFSPSAAQNYTGNMVVTGNFLNHPTITIPLSGMGFNNVAPTATNVAVTGPPVIHQTLTGAYQFNDSDGNAEGTSIMKWYHVMGASTTPIPGANTATYLVTDADLGIAIAFEVTPVDIHGMPGTPVMSPATVPIEALPAPQNLAGLLSPPDTVTLTWEMPNHYNTRGFVGYRLYRNGLNISTITNPSVLTFTDTYVPEGTHEYWVCSLFNNPMELSEPSNVVTIQVGETSNDDLVNSANLEAVISPNPFVGSTNIGIKAIANNPVTLKIFNLKGQMVNSFSLRADAFGNASLIWDGKDTSGKIVDSGIYLYQMESQGKSINGKLIRTK